MNRIQETLSKVVREIQLQQGYPEIEMTSDSRFVKDLGFTSLDIAQLLAMMENELDVDPFSEGARLDQISTVMDLSNLYLAHTASNT